MLKVLYCINFAAGKLFNCILIIEYVEWLVIRNRETLHWINAFKKIRTSSTMQIFIYLMLLGKSTLFYIVSSNA